MLYLLILVIIVQFTIIYNIQKENIKLKNDVKTLKVQRSISVMGNILGMFAIYKIGKLK